MLKIHQILRFIIALSFFNFAFTQMAWAGFEEARDAYEREDYTTAFREYKLLAEQGELIAQLMLASMYETGHGVSKDEQQAAAWFRKAAEQGDAEAQFNLGSMYHKGEGVPKDEQHEAFWFRKAAEQGLERAQYILGYMYEDGIGVSKDEKLAVEWYRKAAEQGYALAQLNLGAMYANGKGVTKDDQQAVLWFRKAAEQGDSKAQLFLGSKYQIGDGVPKNKQRAYFWWLLAGANGDEDARRLMGEAEKTLLPQQRAQAQADARAWRAKTAQQVAEIGLPKATVKSSRDTVKRSPSAPQTEVDKSSGTGFVVSPNQIVTNLHVVDGCVVLKVNGSIATISVMDTSNDLALITTSRNSSVATLRAGDLRQGDEINAVGYPLYGLLAKSAQITSGNVSALAGMQNDTSFIQISAPVQPGNSGGPLVDASGNVVGVISSKLNAVAIATLNGDIPQNINFAISPLVLKGFLEANQVKYKTAVSNKKMSTADVMNIATRYTVLVECTK